jgi:hypothetical protein
VANRSFLHRRGVFMQIAVVTYATNKGVRKITIIEEIQKQFPEKNILIAIEILESYLIL